MQKVFARALRRRAAKPVARSSSRSSFISWSSLSPRTKKFVSILAISLSAFSPKMARALDSREAPLNPASFADTKNVRLVEKYQVGAPNKAFEFDALRLGARIPICGMTNSGPVFIYENVFNRTTDNSLRFGLAQKVSLPANALLKLGVLSPDTLAQKQLLRDARFGVIFSKGFFGADYLYRGLVKGKPSHGGGVTLRANEYLSVGGNVGSAGFSSPNVRCSNVSSIVIAATPAVSSSCTVRMTESALP